MFHKHPMSFCNEFRVGQKIGFSIKKSNKLIPKYAIKKFNFS